MPDASPVPPEGLTDEELIHKFRSDIAISRARTRKQNPTLLTITANDAEALCDAAAQRDKALGVVEAARNLTEHGLSVRDDHEHTPVDVVDWDLDDALIAAIATFDAKPTDSEDGS